MRVYRCLAGFHTLVYACKSVHSNNIIILLPCKLRYYYFSSTSSAQLTDKNFCTFPSSSTSHKMHCQTQQVRKNMTWHCSQCNLCAHWHTDKFNLYVYLMTAPDPIGALGEVHLELSLFSQHGLSVSSVNCVVPFCQDLSPAQRVPPCLDGQNDK